MPIKPLASALLVLALALGGTQAAASDHDAAPAKTEGGEARKSEEGKAVTLPTLIAPVVEGQRLTGYIYLSIRLTTAGDEDADHLRDVLPLVQDALLRALNDSPVPAAEAESPAAKDALAKTVMATLQRLADIHGIRDVAFADYQNVPF